jgi:hypothetical protein
MTMQPSDSNNYLKQIMILYIALLAGQVLFLGMILFLNYSGGIASNDQEMKEIFIYIVPITAMVCALGGHFYFKSRLEKIKQISNLSEKLNAYRPAFIVGCALLEGPFLFSVIAFMLTSSYIFPVIGFILLVIFLFLMPTKNKLVNDMELNPKESSDLDTIGVSSN